MIFRGLVTEDGKLELDEPARWLAVLATLRKRVVQVTLERGRRSLKANAYYWAGIVEPIRQLFNIGREWPINKERIHDLLVRSFLGEEMTPLGPVPKSTHDLPSDRFALYIEVIRAHAASEWGLDLPGPEDWKEAA